MDEAPIKGFAFVKIEKVNDEDVIRASLHNKRKASRKETVGMTFV